VETIRIPDDFSDQTPQGRALATETVMNVIRTADLLFDGIGRLLRPLGVSSAGGLVLGLLRDHGALSPSALGEKLIVTRATVTGLVDSLERRGFVERSPHPEDRRSLLIRITPSGLEVLAEVRRIVHDQERDWLDGFTDEELTALIAAMHRVQRSVTEPDAPA
jgi:DNA-binding MarR family transcriptional regulator